MKRTIYLLIAALFSGCVPTKNSAVDNYVFRRKTPMGIDIHEISLNKIINTFSYEYLNNMYGKQTGVIYGSWAVKNDSLFFQIAYPIDYRIKKSFVSYSNFKSADSIYFMFYNLFPEILNINRNIYRTLSMSLIDNCITDTCPSYESFESSVLPNAYFGDTITIPRKYYISVNQDTLNIFDPNKELVDRLIPIKTNKFNCIKIYLARKPIYDFLDIPTKYVICNRRLYFTDIDGQKKSFKMKRK